MKVLVTGGAGFIGSHVVDQLIAAGHNVSVLDDLTSGDERNVPKGLKFYRLSLNDPKLDAVFKKERFDAVCHLAAKTNMRESLTDPIADLESNVAGLVRLLELAAKKYPVKKFVFASTGGALYGDTRELPVAEDAPTKPISPYGVGKLAGERYLYYYHAVHGLPVVILRNSNVYGPRNERKKYVGSVVAFIRNIMAGNEIVINGDGRQTRDFIYVEDVARANVLALARTKRDFLTCNVSGGSETSINALIRSIEKHTGKKAKVRRNSGIPGEVRRSYLENKKASRELKWKPKHTVEAGVKKTVAYLQELP